MTYQMNLNDGPFQLISSGQKEVEMRLNTPKRAVIKPGDHIVFTNEKDGKQIEVLVLNIMKFPSFKELYENIDNTKLGYIKGEKADYQDMYFYYKKEDIQKYGVLAIFIKLLLNNNF